MTYIRVQHVKKCRECSLSDIYPGSTRRKSRRKFVISGPIDHNDQPHPFGKNYIRMMRKTFWMCPFGRFWIKSFKEKLWSKKYFFSIRFRCSHRSAGFSDICSPLLFLIFLSRSIDIPTWWLGYGLVQEEEARTKRIIRQLSNTGGEKVEDI